MTPQSTRGEHISAHHRSYERLWFDLVLSYCHTVIRFTRASDIGHIVLAEVGYRSCITYHLPSTIYHLQCVAAPIRFDLIRSHPINLHATHGGVALVYGTYASSPLIQSIAHLHPRPVIIISCKQLRSIDTPRSAPARTAALAFLLM